MMKQITAILASVALTGAAHSQDPLANLRQAVAEASAQAPLGDIIVTPPPFGYPVYDQAVEGRIIQTMKLLEGWRDRHIENDEKVITELGRLNQTATEAKEIGQKTLDVIGDPAAYQVKTPPGSQIMNYETDFDELEKTANKAFGDLAKDTKPYVDKEKYASAKMLSDAVSQAKSVVATSSALRKGNEAKLAEILNRVSTAQTFADLQKAQAELQAMTTAQQILANDEQGAMNIILLAEKAAQADTMLKETTEDAARVKTEAEEIDEMEANSKKAAKELPEKIRKAQKEGLEKVKENWLKGSGDFESDIKELRLGERLKKSRQELFKDELIVIPASLPQEEIDRRVKYCEKHNLKYIIK